jgi:hypothetical protein
MCLLGFCVCAPSDPYPSPQAFLSTSLTLGEKLIATHFHEIQTEMRMVDADRVGIELLRSQKTSSLPDELDGLQASINKLQAMIDDTLTYVDGVCKNPTSGNKAIGRYLMDTVQNETLSLIGSLVFVEQLPCPYEFTATSDGKSNLDTGNVVTSHSLLLFVRFATVTTSCKASAAAEFDFELGWPGF